MPQDIYIVLEMYFKNILNNLKIIINKIQVSFYCTYFKNYRMRINKYLMN